MPGLVHILVGVMLSAAVVVVQGNFGSIDTTKVTHLPAPRLRELAKCYADSSQLGAGTVADRITAFRAATRFVLFGVLLAAGSLLLVVIRK